MDDLAALSQSAVADRPKRGLEEVVGADALLQHRQQLYSVPASLPSGSPASSTSPIPSLPPPFNIPYSSPGMSSSIGAMSYIPGYEWWPQLVGPASGPSYAPAGQEFGFHAASAGPSTGGGGGGAGVRGTSQLMPGPHQSLFTFDQSQLSDGFMQGVAGPSQHQQQEQEQRHHSQPPRHPGTSQHHPQQQQHHRTYGQGHGYPPP